MKINIRVILIMLLFFPFFGFSQQKDTLLNRLHSLSKKTDSAGTQLNNTNPDAYNNDTKLSVISYFTLLGSDLKPAFTNPFIWNIRIGGDLENLLSSRAHYYLQMNQFNALQ